ncbi:hypothetical protein HNR07_004406 [Nocardiopsis metallicus]|uniref:Uncharacterized protein n=1 Tax=Nocardiopsis metallicus TaxID=179819 RepID=A0A840W8C6_9ACTN|nr:hypothetical protein [Nocardiopsis metallicus]
MGADQKAICNVLVVALEVASLDSADDSVAFIVVADALGDTAADVMDADAAGLSMDGAVVVRPSTGVCAPLTALNIACHILFNPISFD